MSSYTWINIADNIYLVPHQYIDCLNKISFADDNIDAIETGKYVGIASVLVNMQSSRPLL